MEELAAFTVTRNERLFLRLWCNYYASVFPPEHLYVINNSTDDGSIEEMCDRHPGINIVNRPHRPHHDSMFLKRIVEGFQAELLARYKAVVFAEADEYLIPITRYAGLLDYCKQFLASDKPYVRAEGWNVVHQIDTEPELELGPGEQLLARRNSMWRIQIYDKTLITKVPLTYQKGFHNFYADGGKQGDHPVDADLALLHAWRVSLKEYVRRHAPRTGASPEAIERYFRTHEHPTAGHTGDSHAIGEETTVPEHWRPLLTW